MMTTFFWLLALFMLLLSLSVRPMGAWLAPLATEQLPARWRALDAGLVTMRDSALELVLQGVIPLSELPRILPEERLAPEPRGGIRSSE